MSGRCIVMLSGKGGVGKTMLTAALGAALVRRGRRVVLVDMNLGMRALDMCLGLESRVGYDLGDVVDEGVGLDRALLEDRRTGVRMIAARQFDTGGTMREQRLRLILEVLRLQNDYILLDAPGGPGYALELSIRMADEALLVTTPDDAALRNAERTLSIAAQLEGPRSRLVVNRLRADLVDEGLQYAPETCAQVLDTRLIASVAEDGQAMRATLRKEALDGSGPAAMAVANLAARLEDASVLPWPWRDA